jgi:CRISPR-associated protein Cmr3
MKYVRLFLEPVDVWFFRAGKPFTMGEDQWARSYFPPSPNTVQGAIRSRVLAAWGGVAALENAQLLELIGGPGSYGRLRLRGPFLARQENGKVVRYFPVPTDVVAPKDGGQLCRLHVGEWDGAVVNPPADGLRPLLSPIEGDFEAAQGWLSEPELGKYLQGQPFSLTPTPELFRREHRLGIGLEYKPKRPKEQRLYQAGFIRPADGVGLVVDVGLEEENDPLRALKLPSDGWLALGGEARPARFRLVNADASSLSIDKSERFSLYFATPAYFMSGWRPNIQVRLVAAAAGRPQLIGGWDLVEQKPKPIRRYVPAGSVYFYETDAPISVDLPVTDNQNEAHIGFGQVFVGQWPPESLA